MADKQPQLNGAYYGPMVPPTEAPPRQQHPHRGRRCCCCLFSFFWKLVLAIVIFLVLVFLIFWAVVQPRAFRIHVTDAHLTQFNYTAATNTLAYNLVLNFTARNPNKKLNIYYDQVEAHASYDGVRFNSTDVITWRNAFRQYTKTTDTMRAVFSGQRVMVLDDEQVVDFEGDKKRGVFDIDVRLNFRFRYRLGDVIGDDSKAKAKCELEVPLTSRANNGVTVFLPTGCDVHF
ncbi:hypothetical protein VNO78_21118 [Psophocarpus tetragonolobus]|uniref:Late embryogenesis abundant protein LEA-2 subgroup domain-containing protein n=1 Tax=Psophocarpus tetragonolobus TaxID=3891 RepID=A0AAN9SAL5_PSOTE